MLLAAHLRVRVRDYIRCLSSICASFLSGLLIVHVIMANLIRSAKSGSDWTVNDLDSYHINLSQEDPLVFFGVQVGIDSLFSSRRPEWLSRHRRCHSPLLIKSC